MLNLLRHELRVRRGAVIGWGIGVAAFGAIYTLIYPQFFDQLGGFDLDAIPIYQAFGITMATFDGWVASSFINFLPVWLGIYAIVNGTGTLAGEEDNGTLEPLMALPLPRWLIVVTKALAMAIAVFLILLIASLGTLAALAAVQGQVETDLVASDLVVVTLNGWPITMAFMMMSLFLGALLPNRRSAAMAATVVFVISYFGDSLSSLVQALDPLRPLFLFYFYDASPEVFTTGIRIEDVLVFLVLALAFLGLAILSFQRRDVTVGAWPWQRSAAPGAR